MALASADYELLLRAIDLLNSDSKLETLPSRTLNSVFSIIPNELVAFDGFGTDANYSGNLWYSPPDTVSEEKVQILAELVHQHPYHADVVVQRKQKTARVTEYLSLREFHRTALYNEFYKYIGGDTQITTCLNVSPELFVACSLHRLKRDFTDRDCKLLNLLTPHLVSAFKNAQLIQQLVVENKNLHAALDMSRYGFLSVNMNLIVSCQSSTAMRLLHKYFPVSNNLPEEVVYFINLYRETILSGEFYLPLSLLADRKTPILN